MNKKQGILVIFMVVFILVVGGYAVYSTFGNLAALRPNKQAPQEPTEKQEQTSDSADAASQVETIEVTETKLSYRCQPNKTALELLEAVATVKVRKYSFGTQVLAINGVEQENDRFWLYKIDDDEATVAADLYTCSDKEEIKWELR